MSTDKQKKTEVRPLARDWDEALQIKRRQEVVRRQLGAGGWEVRLNKAHPLITQFLQELGLEDEVHAIHLEAGSAPLLELIVDPTEDPRRTVIVEVADRKGIRK